MPKNRPSISIFFPFFNDWGTVGSLIGLAISTVRQLTDDWEVIIVNDGSRKEDREALEEIINVILNSFQDPRGMLKSPRLDRGILAEAGQVQHDKRVKIIDHEKNRGYGGALRSGFAAATKDLVFYTDCDAQYDPRELTKLYQAMEGNKREIGMVNGYKIKRSDPWYRTLAGKIYHHLVKFAFGLPIRDTDCDFRLIRREVFDPSVGSTSSPQASSGRTAVRLFENTGTICVELVKKVDYHGFRIVEVPVHHFWRTSGKSQFFNFKRLYKTGTNLVRLWWKLIVLEQC